MRGYTVLELLVAMMIAGILLGIAIPRAQRQLDRITVQSARGDVRATLTYARTLALAGQTQVVVSFDAPGGTIVVRRGGGNALSRGVAHAHGVELRSSRDSLIYDAHGIGRGAANLSVILKKRAAAETVFVSRLGRVR